MVLSTSSVNHRQVRTELVCRLLPHMSLCSSDLVCRVSKISRIVLQAQRTKLALPLVKAAKRCIMLSGTPALSRPTELFTQLQGLLPKAGITKKAFEDRYAVYSHYGNFPKLVSMWHAGWQQKWSCEHLPYGRPGLTSQWLTTSHILLIAALLADSAPVLVAVLMHRRAARMRMSSTSC